MGPNKPIVVVKGITFEFIIVIHFLFNYLLNLKLILLCYKSLTCTFVRDKLLIKTVLNEVFPFSIFQLFNKYKSKYF